MEGIRGAAVANDLRPRRMSDDAVTVGDGNGANASEARPCRCQARPPFGCGRFRAPDAAAVDRKLPQRGVAGCKRFRNVFGRDERKVGGASLGRHECVRVRSAQLDRTQRAQDHKDPDRHGANREFSHRAALLSRFELLQVRSHACRLRRRRDAGPEWIDTKHTAQLRLDATTAFAAGDIEWPWFPWLPWRLRVGQGVRQVAVGARQRLPAHLDVLAQARERRRFREGDGLGGCQRGRNNQQCALAS